MIRTTTVPRPARVAAAMAGVAGVIALAGCSTGGTADESAGTPAADSGASTAPQTSDAASYADGTYTGEGSYATPETVEKITVTVTLVDDVITEVEVVGQPQKAESKQYQGQFVGGISEVVVGKDIDEISVSRVAGSSLTSGGFNQAIEQIKSEAAV